MTFGAASAAWAAIYGVAGAIIGSFVAALVLRWMDEVGADGAVGL